MATIVNMHAAKTQLSRLVERAQAGEEIILARAGTPVARLVPFERRRARLLGRWRGKVRMSKDFDAPLPEDELRGWLGGE